MTGQHIADLKHRTTGMDLSAIADVYTSSRAWGDGATTLSNVVRALVQAAPKIREGFGAGSTIGNDAHDAFVQAGDRIATRQADLENAEKVLKRVQPAMVAAREAAAGAPDSAPGNPPPFPETNGDEDDEIRAIKSHARDMATYNSQVSAYADADENARKKVQDLKDRYNEAAEVFRKIHGEPEDPPPGGGRKPGEVPGGGVPPIGRPHHPYVPPPISHLPTDPQYPTPVDPPTGTENPPPIHHPIDPGRPPQVPTGYPPVDPTGPHVPGGPGGGGGGGVGGVGPSVIGGATAAGVFGAPGLVNGLRGLLNGRGLSGAGGTIGSTTRAGGPGSLTRGAGGAGAPGSQVNRAGGRGAGGRGGAAGGAGGRGGKQGGRGRGGAAAAGGRRGERRRDDENGQERDLFDDGQDWLDDEGAAPGVLD